MQITDTLSFLLGSWELRRSITDHRSGSHGLFCGRAVLAGAQGDAQAGAGRARYDEEGELSFGAHRGPASRHLEYVRLDSAAVFLYFSNGRPFVDLDLRTGGWRSFHDCVDDRYELHTVVRSDRVVQEYWRVRGPATSYDAVTTLTRVG
jgi:hypothetical protein